MLGSLVWSILPTSQTNTLLTGSKLYLPYTQKYNHDIASQLYTCDGVRVQFSTDLCMGISILT